MNTRIIRRIGVRRRWILSAAAATLALVELAACSSGGSSSTGTAAGGKKKVFIAVSQAFSSNAWQTANNGAITQAINILKTEGKISKYEFVDANNNVSTQISQISALIVEHPDVIMINPTSSSGLNGVIAKAIAAKIQVLVFSDGPVTSKEPYEVVCDLTSTGLALTKYIGQRLGGKGTILDVRGVAGAGGDQTFEYGVQQALKQYPNLKIANTLYGNWDEATTESKVAQVLPGLPKIDAVIQQGGEGYGVAEAFAAAGRPVPLIVMGNQGAELKWWNEQKQKNGYQTLSIGTNPGIGASSVYVAYALATGQKVPKWMYFPNLTIDQDSLANYLDVSANGQATKIYDAAWTSQNILNQSGQEIQQGQ